MSYDLQAQVDALKEEVRMYQRHDPSSELRAELRQLKQEFREFLKYSKVQLSYELHLDDSEPAHITTLIPTFRTAND